MVPDFMRNTILVQDGAKLLGYVKFECASNATATAYKKNRHRRIIKKKRKKKKLYFPIIGFIFQKLSMVCIP